jgi:hypothetical protein
MRVLFFFAVAVVAFLGFRHVLAICTGHDRCGELKPGQRLCHLTSMLILWLSCGLAVFDGSLWPLGLGVVVEWAFRTAIGRSGGV